MAFLSPAMPKTIPSARSLENGADPIGGTVDVPRRVEFILHSVHREQMPRSDEATNIVEFAPAEDARYGATVAVENPAFTTGDHRE